MKNPPPLNLNILNYYLVVANRGVSVQSECSTPSSFHVFCNIVSSIESGENFQNYFNGE